jgi:drug/metabolite transporter (DMT)-like permease
MTSQNSTLTRGYLIALLSAALLSTTAIFIRYLTVNYHLPALVLAFWRDTFVFLCLLIALKLLHPLLLKLETRLLLFIGLYGLLLALFNSLWTLSVALNGAAVSTVLAYCSAAFTAVLGWWFLHERLNWVKLLAVAFSLAGCVLVSDALRPEAWRTNTIGIITGVLSGLAYAVYSLMGRSASQRGLNPWTTEVYTFGFAAALLLVFNLVLGNLVPGTATGAAGLLWLGKAWAGWGILLVLAAGPTLLGFGLYNTSLTYLPSSVANLIVTIEPVFTAIIAYFLLGEHLSELQMLGGLLIISGVVFLRVFEDRAENESLVKLQSKAQPLD